MVYFPSIITFKKASKKANNLTDNDLVRLVSSFCEKEKILKAELEINLDETLENFLTDTETEISKKWKKYYEKQNQDKKDDNNNKSIPEIYSCFEN